MLMECSRVLAPHQEQAVLRKLLTENSNFQQLCNFLRLEWMLVGPVKGYPYAGGMLLVDFVLLEIIEITVIFTYTSPYA